jgi:hypothetical protein
LSLDDLPGRGVASSADQLVLQIGGAHVEAKYLHTGAGHAGAEPGPLNSAPEAAFRTGVTQASYRARASEFMAASGKSAAPRTLGRDPPGLWCSQPRRPCCNRHAAPDRRPQAMSVLRRVCPGWRVTGPARALLLILTGAGCQRRAPGTQPAARSGWRGPAGTLPIALGPPGGCVAPQRAADQAGSAGHTDKTAWPRFCVRMRCRGHQARLRARR